MNFTIGDKKICINKIKESLTLNVIGLTMFTDYLFEKKKTEA